jgi:hypothetical protein
VPVGQKSEVESRIYDSIGLGCATCKTGRFGVRAIISGIKNIRTLHKGALTTFGPSQTRISGDNSKPAAGGVINSSNIVGNEAISKAVTLTVSIQGSRWGTQPIHITRPARFARSHANRLVPCPGAIP